VYPSRPLNALPACHCQTARAWRSVKSSTVNRSYKGVATFEFQDNGPGVAVSDQPHIFERLYRAEKSRSRATGGAGLGLAIAKGLVEAMGGTIQYRPGGAGAVFAVSLPMPD
jgi:two-component system sensor histidine kinase BaeS